MFATALRVLVLTFLLSSLAGQDLRSPRFLEDASVGFQQIFNLDYDEAGVTFGQLARAYPKHPGPPLYHATSIWLQELFQRQEIDLDKFVSLSHFDKPSSIAMSQARRERFQRLMSEARSRCDTILQSDPGHKDGRYFAGAIDGILGSFAMTIDRSRRQAFSYGKSAYRYHLELLTEDPEYHDALMTVGLYEYIVGNLPWYIKILASIVGYSGSKERGFEHLATAVRKGQFVADDARTLQLVLFVREKRLADALDTTRYLRSKAPRNYIVLLNEAQILEWMGRNREAAQRYREVLTRAEKKEPNFHRLPLREVRHKLAQKLLDVGDAETALEEFDRTMKDSGTPADVVTQAMLGSGQALDLLTRRAEAVKRYNAVLEKSPGSPATRKARGYLRRPFSQNQ